MVLKGGPLIPYKTNPLKPVFYAEHRRLGVHRRLGLIKPILRLVFYAEHRRLGVHIRLGLIKPIFRLVFYALLTGGPLVVNAGCGVAPF
jgi:hypothetical protein